MDQASYRLPPLRGKPSGRYAGKGKENKSEFGMFEPKIQLDNQATPEFSSDERLSREERHGNVPSRMKFRNSKLKMTKRFSCPVLPFSARQGVSPAFNPNLPQGLENRDSSTPQVLYRDYFGQIKGKETSSIRQPQSLPTAQQAFTNSGADTQRNWQKVQVRLPSCYSSSEQQIVSEVLQLLTSREATFSASGLPRPVVEFVLAERPSSRLQARLLAVWFGNQISTLADRGAVMMGTSEAERYPISYPGCEHAPQDPAHPQALGGELAERLMALWTTEEAAAEPFPWMDVPVTRVEGVKLPNDRRFLQAMLQVSGAAAAALTQQVGMHCRERGRLLAGVWNLYVGLAGFESAQLRKSNDFLMEENRRQRELIHIQSSEDFEFTKLRLKELEQFQREALVTMRSLRVENDAMRRLLESSEGATSEAADSWRSRLQELEAELEEARQMREDLEAQLNVSFTALHAVTATGTEAKEELSRLQVKFWDDEYGDLPAGGKDELSSDLAKLGFHIDEIVEIESMLEEQLRNSSRSGSQIISRLMQSKQAALYDIASRNSKTNVDRRLRSKQWSRRSSMRQAEQGAPSGGNETPVIGGDEPDQAEAGTAEEAAEEEGDQAAGSPRWEDIDDMKRDEMRDEIERLREKEENLMALLAAAHHADSQAPHDGPPAQGAGAADRGSLDPTGKPPGGQRREGLPAAADGEAGPDAPLHRLAGFQSQHKFLSALTRALLGAEGGGKQGEGTKDRHARATTQEAGRKNRRKENRAAKNADEVSAAKALDAARVAVLKMRQEYEMVLQGLVGTAEGTQHRAGSRDEALGTGATPPDPDRFFDGIFKALNLAVDADDSHAVQEGPHPDKGAAGGPGVGEAAAHPEEPAPGSSQQHGDTRRDPVDDKRTKKNRHKRGGKTPGGQTQASEPQAEGELPGAELVARKMSESKHRSLRRIAGAVGKIAVASAPRLPAFYVKDQMLKDALYKNIDAPPKTPEWAVKVAEAVYKKSGVQGLRSYNDVFEAATIPKILIAHFSSQYGAKKIVQEYVAAMVATLRKHSSSNVQLQTFNKFLSEEWSNLILLHYLEALGSISAAGSAGVACIEFPVGDQRQRSSRYVCTRKAQAVANRILGPRSQSSMAAFQSHVLKKSSLSEADDKALHFWSPHQGDSCASEEERNGPMRKLPLHEFLHMLCAEAEWLEQCMAKSLPGLFKHADLDGDGLLSRQDVLDLVDGCYRSISDFVPVTMDQLNKSREDLWQNCHQAARVEEGHEGPESGSGAADIGYAAFVHGCMRSDIIRKFARLVHSRPSPPEEDNSVREVHNKNMYLVVQRSIEQFSECWDMIKNSGLGDDESHLLGHSTRVENELDGVRRASLFVQFLRGLMEHKIKELEAESKESRTNPLALELLLENMQRALKVAFGYKSMIEDDVRIFAAMIEDGSTLATRTRASRLWKTQVNFFWEYKRELEKHAVNVLQVEFGGRLMRRVLARRTGKSEVADGTFADLQQGHDGTPTGTETANSGKKQTGDETNLAAAERILGPKPTSQVSFDMPEHLDSEDDENLESVPRS